ncbi:MAG: carbamoyl-phosphate synthase large subunit [Gammaproteobacteria bacterium]|nr:carbamoyl-phosphate synthase large subunit [Gammaproteobacteria bacterium]
MSRSAPIRKLLIANRGEIAVRIQRTAMEMGIQTLGVGPADDSKSLHLFTVDESVELTGTGPAAYLDSNQVVELAKSHSCDAIHPGYGFLAENAEFAEACEQADLIFVGPSSKSLKLFGDKLQARELAASSGVPVLPASTTIESPEDAIEFFKDLPSESSMILKAIAGGGGRGMRVVSSVDEIEQAVVRGGAEALASFGSGKLFAELYVPDALHIEIQVLADRHGNVSQIGERDCSIQRRHQKVVEVAPSPQLSGELRTRIQDAAVSIARGSNYDHIGTFEFLVDGSDLSEESPFYFIEANPRIQVEHTVTEEVTGVDLVRTQLHVASGATLQSLGLDQNNAPDGRGSAMQLRINLERMQEDGVAISRSGLISEFEPASGPGIRVDTYGYEGYETSNLYDSLIAKLVVFSGAPRFDDLIRRARRALTEFRIAGVETNLDFLANILEHPKILSGNMRTRFIEEHTADLVKSREPIPRIAEPLKAHLAGAKVDADDPLAVLTEGRRQREQERSDKQPEVVYAKGLVPVRAAMQSTILSLTVSAGRKVVKGQEVILLNAMKMEHVVKAPVSGTISEILIAEGDAVPEDTVLLVVQEGQVEGELDTVEDTKDLDVLRPDLAEVERRRAFTTDSSRKKQTEKRHGQGGRTARENIYDLADDGTFVQYGSLAIGQGLHGTIDELLDYAPSDGLVMGLGHVNGDKFDESRSRCVLMSYDYSVLAGSQGGMNHKMMDRMFQTAEKLQSPLVLFTEGGGGRAGGGSRAARPGRGGSRAISGGGGLNTPSWTLLSKLHGRVPVVGVNAGFCFAGNAVLLGCCDVIIATANSSIGIGGPAMIEGGGLGVYSPEEVGPMSVQIPSGVVDIAVEDEAEAVVATKKYLSYFQGPIDTWKANDQRLLRHVIPENRLRVYDIRELIRILADKDSVLELRPEFGTAMITSFIRIEGRPVGVIANNPAVISGAIDSPAADKAARFMKTCDAFQIPLLLLCDCPGIMVGPEVEKTGLVRHSARMFVIGANIRVPTYMVILRKSYGLGGQAMGGGNHRLPAFVVAWPTSEFGGMGLEGQVKLGQRARLEAITDLKERTTAYENMVKAAYDRGKGLNAGHVFEVDDVIDPADTRKWLMAGMKAGAPLESETQYRTPLIDVW